MNRRTKGMVLIAVLAMTMFVMISTTDNSPIEQASAGCMSATGSTTGNTYVLCDDGDAPSGGGGDFTGCTVEYNSDGTYDRVC